MDPQTPQQLNRADGTLTTIVGASRSGKTVSALAQVRNERRVLVWDYQGQWVAHGFEESTDLAALADRLEALGNSPARIAVRVPFNELNFDLWSECAMAWGIVAPIVAVAEELADVTRVNKAVQWWGALVRGGLKYGIDIVAITQRPQECDKTVLGNASVLRAFRMVKPSDEAHVAEYLRVAVEAVTALGNGEYLERDFRTETPAQKGKIQIRTPRPSANPAEPSPSADPPPR